MWSRTVSNYNQLHSPAIKYLCLKTMSDLSAVTVSRKLSVRFVGEELLSCLSEH